MSWWVLPHDNGVINYQVFHVQIQSIISLRAKGRLSRRRAGRGGTSQRLGHGPRRVEDVRTNQTSWHWEIYHCLLHHCIAAAWAANLKSRKRMKHPRVSRGLPSFSPDKFDCRDCK
ncbi:hypothetical protein M378DRAFT_161951 [Amanita muscaria Koide BX008]|uniref:Uncharacterized protein n=1 Tax=Amanita muscaria (strain Koide BX008) TaxID=946122 RepID=A0A0C2X8K3_AMAMK|nr:hypothetical protein M378DRAFT_161951 [Amanita muscaria Koide BX008]